MNRIRPSQHDLSQFLGGKHGEVRDLVFRHVAGVLSPEQFGQGMRDVLIRGHAGAAYLGRRRAGDMAPYEGDDTRFGEWIADEEEQFLLAFVQDLSVNRYEGEGGQPNAVPILNRAQMYVERMRGSANEAFVLASGQEERFRWVLGASESGACPDCTAKAAGSPYTGRDIPGVPCDGGTRCLSRCACRVVREDGVAGFR